MTSFASFTKRIYRIASIIPAVVIALALFATPAAHAWGCQGHETVALPIKLRNAFESVPVLAKVNQIFERFAD